MTWFVIASVLSSSRSPSASLVCMGLSGRDLETSPGRGKAENTEGLNKSSHNKRRLVVESGTVIARSIRMRIQQTSLGCDKCGSGCRGGGYSAPALEVVFSLHLAKLRRSMAVPSS